MARLRQGWRSRREPPCCGLLAPSLTGVSKLRSPAPHYLSPAVPLPQRPRRERRGYVTCLRFGKPLPQGNVGAPLHLNWELQGWTVRIGSVATEQTLQGTVRSLQAHVILQDESWWLCGHVAS